MNKSALSSKKDAPVPEVVRDAAVVAMKKARKCTTDKWKEAEWTTLILYEKEAGGKNLTLWIENRLTEGDSRDTNYMSELQELFRAKPTETKDAKVIVVQDVVR